jgi:hypothetical protein
MSDRDSGTAPWSNMMYHRVPVANRESATTKVRNLVAVRRSDSRHDPWSGGSARDRARAMLGGTKGSGDIFSVWGSATRSGRRAQTQGIMGQVPLLLRKMVTR